MKLRASTTRQSVCKSFAHKITIPKGPVEEWVYAFKKLLIYSFCGGHKERELVSHQII